MSTSRRIFTPEYKEEKAREVVEKSLSIAPEVKAIGVNEQTLRNWEKGIAGTRPTASPH